MKKVKNKLNLNKNVITQLSSVIGAKGEATYTCTATQPTATTCANTTCNAGTCGFGCGSVLTYLDTCNSAICLTVVGGC